MSLRDSSSLEPWPLTACVSRVLPAHNARPAQATADRGITHRRSIIQLRERSMFVCKFLVASTIGLAASTMPVLAKDLNKIGISLGSMGNPFFVALAKGAEAEAKKTNPNVQVLAFGYDYDIGKQFTQIDNFIASGVDLILLNPADPKAVGPAIKKAQAAGIVVVAFDTFAGGADAVVQTNNKQAGDIACQFLADKLGGKGDVVIINGPQVSAVVDRVNGCKAVLGKTPDIKILSS